MADDLIVHSRIMRRVTRVHHLRLFLHPAAMKAYAGVVLLGFVSSLVSVMDIVGNMPKGITAPLYYVVNAFAHTEIAVQVAIVAVGGVTALLVRDIFHMSRRPTLLRHSA